MKICRTCKVEKAEREFSRDVSKKDNLRSSCKKCESLKKREKYNLLTEKNRRYDLPFNVEDGDDIYHITKDGEVINRRTGNKVKHQLRNGYMYVLIHKRDGSARKKNVHRLLALTYIENPMNKEQVNHIDGNKLNNSLSNLEWVTPRENAIHAVENNLINPSKGKDHWRVKAAGEIGKGIIATDKDGNDFEFEDINDAVRKGFALKSSFSKVYSCCNFKRKTHNGYAWRYA